MTSPLKVLGSIGLLVLAVVGLLMSLCGGYFTASALTAGSISGFLAISIPSLLIGLALAWFATKRFRKSMGKPPGAAIE